MKSIKVSKRWTWFFAILQVGGLLSAFVQTTLIILQVRKVRKGG
jgi:hypothetical protein